MYVALAEVNKFLPNTLFFIRLKRMLMSRFSLASALSSCSDIS